MAEDAILFFEFLNLTLGLTYDWQASFSPYINAPFLGSHSCEFLHIQIASSIIDDNGRRCY